jgi:hypothetical protein
VTQPRLEVIGRRLLAQTRAGEIEWYKTDRLRLCGFAASACKVEEGIALVDVSPGGVVLRLVDDNGQQIDYVDGSMHTFMAVPNADGLYDAESFKQENLIHPPDPPYSEEFPAVLDELHELTRKGQHV